MGKWTSWVVMTGLLAFSASCRRGAPTASAGSEAAARVNGKEILRADVETRFRLRTRDSRPAPSGDAATLLRLQILRELIESEVMKQKAQQLNLEPSEAEIEGELRQFRGAASEEEFRKGLEERGISEADLRNEIARTLTIRKVLEHEVQAKAQVSDSDVRAFYEQNKEMFNLKEPQFRLGVIGVSANPSIPVTNSRNDKALNEAQALRKIQELESRLRLGEDFQQLAREYSEDPQTAQSGGDLGYRSVSDLEQLSPDFKPTILRLKVGELTPILRAQDGYWLFKLLDRREPGQHDLTNPDVAKSIRDELQQRKQQLLSAAFTEQLYNQARVENFLAEEILASSSGK